MNRADARKVLSSYLEQPVASVLAKMGLTPNIVTLLGLAVAGAGAYLISIGILWAGGIVLLASGVFDLFDGALARLTGRTSKFGALLDSVVDRVSEAVILLGLLVFYIRLSSTEGLVLVYLALAGSIMVSYLRARAEGLGIECSVGVMTRPERVVTLGVGLIIGQWWPTVVLVVLGVIAGLTFLTTIQRLIHAWRSLKTQE
ncbi:MAG: CDP-alcohol phosphatidyltransferase family protein [Chloroflexi bacterium]|nr:CDP-alcohol phosphatidyltransferase family protein [Chloroflexota bacterium]